MKRFIVLLLVLTLVLTLSACSTQEESPKPTANTHSGSQNTEKAVHLSFASPGTGTGMYTITALMIPFIKESLPKGSVVDHTTNSPGGYGATILIEQGGANFTVGNGCSNKWSYEDGILGNPPVKNVYGVVGGIGNDFINVMFTQEFVKKTGHTTMEDLIAAKYPVRIATKTAGAFGEVACSSLLETLGVTYKDVESWGGKVYQTDANSIATLLKDGKADITIDHYSSAASAPQELCLTTDMYAAQLSDTTLKALKAKGWEESNIEANSFKGQTKKVYSVGATFAVICSGEVPDYVVYYVTKGIIENATKLKPLNAALNTWVPEKSWEPIKLGVPIHPGAKKYYKEAGLMQ